MPKSCAPEFAVVTVRFPLENDPVLGEFGSNDANVSTVTPSPLSAPRFDTPGRGVLLTNGLAPMMPPM